MLSILPHRDVSKLLITSLFFSHFHLFFKGGGRLKEEEKGRHR